MKQVYLKTYGIWSDVISENNVFYLARDADGVNTYVVKDGLESVRYV